MISDTVIICIIASAITLLVYLMKILYSSKCKMCKIGCIEIRRDTDHEVAVNLGTPRTEQNPSKQTTNLSIVDVSGF